MKTENNKFYLKLASGFIISLFISIATICFFKLLKIQNFKYTVNNITHLIMNTNIFLFIVLFIILFSFCFLFVYNKQDKFFLYIFEYRFVIATFVLIVSVFFELSGSSLGEWANYLGIKNDGLLIGTSRGIRSDEWVVNTPMAFSQYYNHQGAFKYFSNTLRGTPTDAFIVYGQPVRDIAVIFRPFHWGYLFLSPARGLSFFWVSRLIALFLVSFELSMIITNKNKILSSAYGLLITFSPIVQWWFAVNSLIEMLVFGQLAIILIYNYMRTELYIKRILFALALVVCAGAYCISTYPAWQVPLAYVFLSLFIWTVIVNFKEFKVNIKKDIPIFLISFAVLCLGMLYIFTKSMDTIKLISETVYPGHRLVTGANIWSNFFKYAGNIFFPLKDSISFSNPCEMAAFFDFFPMGILMSIYVMIKNRKSDSLLIILLCADVFLSLWNLTTFPEWYAKITLLSNSQPSRELVAIGMVNILLLIRSLYLFKKPINNVYSISIAIVLASVIAILNKKIYNGYLTNGMFVIIFILLTFSFFVLLNANSNFYKKTFAGLCAFIMFISGAFVNPVQTGIDPIYDVPVTKAIKSLSNADDGLWAVEGGSIVYNNLPITVGAPTINSTNTYPTLDRWKIIDKDNKYKDIYNRYAHILLTINNSKKSNFTLIQADLIKVTTNLNNIKKLNVKYILTVNDLSNIKSDSVKIDELYKDNIFRIYKVNTMSE